MKKLSLLLIALSFFSCSDSDNENSEIPKIVGEWKLYRSIELENGVESEWIYQDCVNQSREIFEENGTYSFIYHGFPQGDCLIEYQSTSGVWTYLNGEYDINYTVEYWDGNAPPQTTPIITVIDNNTLNFRYTEQQANGEVIAFYDREFIRVN